MNNINILLIVIAALMLVSCIGVAVLLFRGDAPEKEQKEEVRTISVSASGEVSVKPDVGYIQMGVVVRKPDAREAEQQNAGIMQAVIDAVKEFGLDESDITTSGYYIYPVYDEFSKETPANYEAGNTVEIRVRDLEVLGDIIDAATSAGANRTNSIRFDYEDREQAYNDALANAVENARKRAETIAASSGYRITGIMSISESGSYNSPYFSNTMLYERTADAGSNTTPISTGDMDITANVGVVFETAPLK